MNFYESNSYIWFLCRFYSLHFFTNQKNELKITKKSFLISSIPAIGFLLTFILGYMFVRAEASEMESYGDPSSIFFIASMFGVLAQHFNCFVILFSTIDHRNGILSLYTKLNELDTELKIKLGIKLDYKSMKKNNLKSLITLMVIFSLISTIISFIIMANISYIGVFMVFNFINGIEIISSFEYYYLTKIIKFRFSAINNVLIESIESSKIVPSQVESMIQCHISINRIITDLNKSYGFRKLFGIANDFFLILTQFYACFVLIDNTSNIRRMDLKNLMGLLTIPCVVVKVVVTAITCQKAIKAQMNFGKLLKTFQKNADVSDLVK